MEIRMSECREPATIPVYYANGCTSSATVFGNNAAWLCSCGFKQPLLGSGYLKTSVHCSKCGASYVLKTRGGTAKGRTVPIKVKQH